MYNDSWRARLREEIGRLGYGFPLMRISHLTNSRLSVGIAPGPPVQAAGTQEAEQLRRSTTLPFCSVVKSVIFFSSLRERLKKKFPLYSSFLFFGDRRSLKKIMPSANTWCVPVPLHSSQSAMALLHGYPLGLFDHPKWTSQVRA